ncbi:expressed protein [Echinococcus multilocularis]|uniref:Expressed protein n=1 Tax=Echinococcus multilocularis TaxID=6211 RepID=A0A068XW03_ECHMU|nr:expressed protein [Echinococcus multilocularis]
MELKYLLCVSSVRGISSLKQSGRANTLKTNLTEGQFRPFDTEKKHKRQALQKSTLIFLLTWYMRCERRRRKEEEKPNQP